MSSRIYELEASWKIKLPPALIAQIHQAVEECVDKKIEEVVKKCLREREEQAEKEILELKKIPLGKAIPLVKTYIDKHQGCRTSDIIYDLALHPDVVLRALRELEEKDEIRGEDFE